MSAAVSRHRFGKLLMAAGLAYCIFLICGAYQIGFTLPTTPLEVWIFITGLLSVWLAVKEHIWSWPVGIVNVVLWIILFYQQHLFANMGLQFVYIVTGLLGWYWWIEKKNGITALEITTAPRAIFFGVVAACLALSYPATIFLQHIGGAATYWDGLTTLLSLGGQFFLMKKYRENWLFWIAADVIYIGLFVHQGLYLSAQLYAIFLALCIAGIFEWRAEKEGKEAYV